MGIRAFTTALLVRKFLLHLCVSVSPTFLRCSHMWRPSTNGIYSYLLYKPDHHKRFMDVLIIEGNKLKLVIVQFNIFEMCCRICCRVILCSSSSSSLLLVVLSICCLSCLFVVLSVVTARHNQSRVEIHPNTLWPH